MNSMNVLNENLFKSIVDQIRYSNFEPINSHFTDEQAKILCGRMRNYKIRHFSSLLNSDTSQIDQGFLRYQIHYLVNKALDFYGGKILTFIFQLQKFPKRIRNIEVLVSSLNSLRDSSTNFPKLLLNSNESGIQYQVFFKRAFERNVDNIPLMFVKNTYTNNTYKIGRKGSLIDGLENLIPELLVFKQTLNGEITLYSGFDDDLCDICGRPLTDYISIMYGRGPICRRDYGNPY